MAHIITSVAAGLTLSTLLPYSAAMAQATTAPVDESSQGQLMEIVVTAQKREQNLQKIPNEIIALSSEALAKNDIETSADLGKLIPGLIMGNTGPNPLIYMRGIGGASPGPLSDPAISFNVDGVVFSRPQGATGAFFDLARVEVLKGPQGTLYGRNTASGAFNIVSNDPVFRDEGSVGIEVGTYNEFSTNGMANIEFNDEWALRVAFKTLRHNGYLSLGYNDADDEAGRVKLLFRPGDFFSAKLTTSYFNKGGKGPGDVPVSAVTGTYLNPSNPWQEFLSTGIYPNIGNTIPADQHESTQVFTSQLDLNWNFQFANFTLTPAYVLNTHTGVQYDAGFYQLLDEYSRQYSLEARLASNPGSYVTWVGGVYLLKEDEHYVQNNQLRNLGGAYLITANASPDVAARSEAVFGQATVPIVERLRATLGLRGTLDKKFYTATSANAVVPADQRIDESLCTTPADGCAVRLSSGSNTFRAFNFKAGLDADLTPTSLLYGNIATGYKPGGFDIGNYVGPYKSEKVTSYTVGSKNRFLNNTLQVNAEAFYNDYRDLTEGAFGFGNPPGFGPQPPNTLIAFETINVPRSYTTGIDLDTDYLLTQNDRISFNVEYLRGKFKNFFLPAFPPVGQVATNYSGLIKDRVPKFSGNVAFNHTFTLWNAGKLVAGIDESFSTSRYLTFQRTPPGSLQPGYGMTDAQLTFVSASDKWELGFHANNLTNKAVLVDTLASPGVNPRGDPATSYWGSPMPPRTFLINFEYKLQ